MAWRAASELRELQAVSSPPLPTLDAEHGGGSDVTYPEFFWQLSLVKSKTWAPFSPLDGIRELFQCLGDHQASHIAMAGPVARFNKLPRGVKLNGLPLPRAAQKKPRMARLSGPFWRGCNPRAHCGRKATGRSPLADRKSFNLRSQARDAVNQVSIHLTFNRLANAVRQNRPSGKGGATSRTPPSVS